MKHFSTIVTFALIVIAMNLRVFTAQRSPQKQVIDKYVLYAVPTQNLNEYLNQIDAVLVVKLISTIGPRPVPVPDSASRGLRSNFGAVPDVVTEYRVQVLQIAKPDSIYAGSIITIARPGGELDYLTDYRIVAHDDGIPLIPGKEYLVFLRYREDLKTLTLDPFQAFPVEGGIVLPNGFSERAGFASQIAGRYLAEALATIEGAKR